jgi:hypothetical protein
LSRRFGLLVTLFALALLTVASGARAANDPKLLWKTIETKHFRINYYSTEDEVAEHVATLCESIYDRLVPVVGWPPGTDQKTEIALTDQTDSANGSATALPYDAIQLYVTAPDDMSPLGDVDDWYLELLTHEYTHILHTDHIEGIPKLINRLIGKTFAPNQLEPHWILEGLAVLEESRETSGGRLRSSMWNMWMRADVLEDNLATLDVFSNIPRRWPQGNIWYVYGSFFMQWIVETYGEQALRAMIDDYGRQVIPYAINRSIRRATGRTYEELYRSWIESMKREYGAEAAGARARGLREGVRVTHTGNTYEHPRWIPASSWPDHAGELLFYADDGHTATGQYALPLVRDADGRVTGSREDKRDLLIRTNGIGSVSFMPNGAAVFSSQDVLNNLFFFDDLFELPAHEKSPTGLEGKRIRWSEGWRALDPSVSPDGRQVVFTVNHRGTQRLMIGDVVTKPDGGGGHAVAHVHQLVPCQPFDQAYTPRWSPDGFHVAYSSWSRGGFRDVRIVDPRDGSFVEVTHDRAIDGGPSYSADGRWLYFSSDRTGIMNVYAYELATHRLRQVTNVLNGAYQPEASPDGKSLAYLGYTHEGYDMFVMPLDESRWLDAPPYVDTRPTPAPEPPPAAVTPKAYNPLLTLQPRAYSVKITPGNFGEATIVTALGSDIAGIHAFQASITTEWEHPDLQTNIQYTYTRLPFDVNMSVFRQITPSTNYSLGPNTVQWIQQTVGATTGISYSMPRAFDSQSVNLSYSIANVSGQLPLPASELNPYDLPSQPTRGMLGTVHVGWGYSNAESYLWSVGNEKGFDASVTFDVADPALASDFTGYAATANLATYLQMPWLRHHVLALHVGGGMGGGDRAGQGPFYIGGYVDLPVVNVVQNSLIQGGIQLRGYPVVAQVGNYYTLANAEYRFPILNVDRGPSTLPVFLQRISGNFFVDCGGAFDDPKQAQFLTGVGGELWFDMTLGYILGFTFRAGFARGVSNGGIDKTYFIAAVPF